MNPIHGFTPLYVTLGQKIKWMFHSFESRLGSQKRVIIYENCLIIELIESISRTKNVLKRQIFFAEHLDYFCDKYRVCQIIWYLFYTLNRYYIQCF